MAIAGAEMNWKPPIKGETYIESECGKYRVAAFRVKGRWKYVPFFRNEGIGRASFERDKAKTICEQHSEGKR